MTPLKIKSSLIFNRYLSKGLRSTLGCVDNYRKWIIVAAK